MDRQRARRYAPLAAAFVLVTGSASANSASRALALRAADDLYNLDRDRALEIYRQAVAADPNDAAAHRGMASVLWLSITFRRGNMTVDDYLGKVGRSDIKV